MQRGRFFFAAALALLSVRVWAATPTTIVDLDFSKATDLNKVMINDPGGVVMVVDDGGKKRLRLTDSTGEVSSVFIKTPVPPTADYLATFQFEIKNDGGDPADGFCFVAQTAGPDKIGGGGGSLGYVTGDFNQNSYCVEFNTYAGQGPQSVAWDMNGGRTKFDQTPFEMVDKGIFTAEVRVTPGSITVTISGGSANLKPTQAMTTNFLKVLGCGDNGTLFQSLTSKPIYFGFTAGTGGLGTIQDILNLKIVSPAPAPTAGN